MNDIEQQIYMDVVETNKKANETIECLAKVVNNLRIELKNCRNELCIKCGKYHDVYNGACDGCRYRHDGEWGESL